MKDEKKRSPVNGCTPPNNGRPFTSENAREMGRRGGIVSGKRRREQWTLRQDLEYVLSQETTGENGESVTVQMSTVMALIKAAREGNTRAFEVMRDTIGQKPAEKVEVAAADYSTLDNVVERKKREREP